TRGGPMGTEASAGAGAAPGPETAKGARPETGKAPIKPDYAQARTALIGVVFLQLALARELQAGAGVVSEWIVPGAEVALLLVLSSLTTIRMRRLAHGHDALDDYLRKHGGWPPVLAFRPIGLITVTH